MILSLAGIPLTAGFLGKFYVLTAGASSATWTLIIILILSSTIGLVYYLRVIVAMLSASEGTPHDAGRAALGITPTIALAVLTVALLVLGVYPGPFWNTISVVTTRQ
jgi:NADH-quinone oxidoreductase subunit N